VQPSRACWRNRCSARVYRVVLHHRAELLSSSPGSRSTSFRRAAWTSCSGICDDRAFAVWFRRHPGIIDSDHRVSVSGAQDTVHRRHVRGVDVVLAAITDSNVAGHRADVARFLRQGAGRRRHGPSSATRRRRRRWSRGSIFNCIGNIAHHADRVRLHASSGYAGLHFVGAHVLSPR
jgi:hypothetical protein